MAATKAVKRKHWYYIYQTECVLCGYSTEERIRMYTKKPKDASKRYEYVQFACSSHFM